MPKIMIQNNCGGVVTVQLPPVPKSAAAVVPKGKQPENHPQDHTVNLGKAFDLIPGASVVELGDWMQAKKNPTVQRMLKERVPRSKAPEQEPKLIGRLKLVELRQVADEQPLKAMKAPEALKIIGETLDTGALQTWLKDEERDELRQAIQAQLDELEAPYIGAGHSAPAPEGQDLGGGVSTEDPDDDGAA